MSVNKKDESRDYKEVFTIFADVKSDHKIKI